MHDPLAFATNLALEAGNLLLHYYQQVGLHSSLKTDHTVVTDADLAADRLITSKIHLQYPSDEIISEESSHQFDNNDSSIWIIDPLDGTTNFSLGVSIWGVSIARVIDGYPTLGVIFFPRIRELYTCTQGSGAYLNHSPITVREHDPAQPMSFFSCCSRSFRYYEISVPYKPRILGSDAYTYCMVARGSALLGLNAASKIWDLAAGWLLVKEAGGKIAALEGQSPFPLMPKMDYGATDFPTLSAASENEYNFGKKKIQRKSKFAIVVGKDY